MPGSPVADEGHLTAVPPPEEGLRRPGVPGRLAAVALIALVAITFTVDFMLLYAFLDRRVWSDEVVS